MVPNQVDGSVASKQGLRFVFTDGSRIIYRLSVMKILIIILRNIVSWRNGLSSWYSECNTSFLTGHWIGRCNHPNIYRTVRAWCVQAWDRCTDSIEAFDRLVICCYFKENAGVTHLPSTGPFYHEVTLSSCFLPANDMVNGRMGDGGWGADSNLQVILNCCFLLKNIASGLVLS